MAKEQQKPNPPSQPEPSAFAKFIEAMNVMGLAVVGVLCLVALFGGPDALRVPAALVLTFGSYLVWQAYHKG